MVRAFITDSLLINWRTTQPEQKPATNNDGAANRTPSFKRTIGLAHSLGCNRFKQASETASNILIVRP